MANVIRAAIWVSGHSPLIATHCYSLLLSCTEWHSRVVSATVQGHTATFSVFISFICRFFGCPLEILAFLRWFWPRCTCLWRMLSPDQLPAVGKWQKAKGKRQVASGKWQFSFWDDGFLLPVSFTFIIFFFSTFIPIWTEQYWFVYIYVWFCKYTELDSVKRCYIFFKFSFWGFSDL